MNEIRAAIDKFMLNNLQDSSQVLESQKTHLLEYGKPKSSELSTSVISYLTLIKEEMKSGIEKNLTVSYWQNPL